MFEHRSTDRLDADATVKERVNVNVLSDGLSSQYLSERDLEVLDIPLEFHGLLFQFALGSRNIGGGVFLLFKTLLQFLLLLKDIPHQEGWKKEG